MAEMKTMFLKEALANFMKEKFCMITFHQSVLILLMIAESPRKENTMISQFI